ncbi:MAG: tRNA (adenosine(37)-N6)-threonylcarbamoyltransferase complex transferase subunit TsaD [Kiritimatiellia bacterium]
MRILAIETSCDETSAAVVEDGRRVLCNLVHTQIARHRPYGGVVPEIACRLHLEVLPGLLGQALADAGVSWPSLDAIAVTRGPGLASSLLVGISAAKGLAFRLGVPLLGVNHLEGHICSVFLSPGNPPPGEACPCLLLLVSGGHTQLMRVERPGVYQVLGGTLDDAAGEALDKGAKLLGLGYPGGPELENAARGGDPGAVDFPRGNLRHRDPGAPVRLDFSFSGLKTSLLYHLRAEPAAPAGQRRADLAASYQESVVDALASQCARALDAQATGGQPPFRAFACVGGVARNTVLRERLAGLAARHALPLLLAAPEYCTDNAAMIAAAAFLCPCETGNFDATPSIPLG